VCRPTAIDDTRAGAASSTRDGAASEPASSPRTSSAHGSRASASASVWPPSAQTRALAGADASTHSPHGVGPQLKRAPVDAHARDDVCPANREIASSHLWRQATASRDETPRQQETFEPITRHQRDDMPVQRHGKPAGIAGREGARAPEAARAARRSTCALLRAQRAPRA
jgi:hypothetical protein